MKNWMTPALAIVAVVTMSHAALAQDKMAQPMGKEKTYTGCVAAGETPGSFMLTNPMAEMGKGGDAMKKNDAMGKETMAKPMMIESKTIDLSKHVGHKVSVTGPDSAMAMGKPDAMSKDHMGKGMSAWSVTTLKMVAATCGM
jgi:hypothetical protein